MVDPTPVSSPQTQDEKIKKIFLAVEDLGQKTYEANASSFAPPDAPKIAIKVYFKRIDYINAISIYEYYYYYNFDVPEKMITVTKDSIRFYIENKYDFTIRLSGKSIIQKVREFIQKRAEQIAKSEYRILPKREDYEEAIWRSATKLYVTVYREVVELLMSSKINKAEKCKAVNVLLEMPHSPGINTDDEPECWVFLHDHAMYCEEEKVDEILKELYKESESKYDKSGCYSWYYDDDDDFFDDDEDDP